MGGLRGAFTACARCTVRGARPGQGCPQPGEDTRPLGTRRGAPPPGPAGGTQPSAAPGWAGGRSAAVWGRSGVGASSPRTRLQTRGKRSSHFWPAHAAGPAQRGRVLAAPRGVRKCWGAPRCCRRVRGAAVGEEAHGRQRPHGWHRGTAAQLGLGRRHRGTRAWPRGSPCTGEVVHECASACMCVCTGVCTRRRVPRAGCVFSAGPCRWVCRERLAPVRSPGGAGGGRGHWQSHHV